MDTMAQRKGAIRDMAKRISDVDCYIFWVERIITITLTCLWIHSFFNFFLYSRRSILFDYVASASVFIFSLTNSCFLFECCFFVCFSRRAPSDQEPQVMKQDEDTKKLIPIKSYAFWIERAGMVLLIIVYHLLEFTFLQFFHITRTSCIILFPVANMLYSESYIFGRLKGEGESSGGKNVTVEGNGQDRWDQPQMGDDTSTNSCIGTTDEVTETKTSVDISESGEIEIDQDYDENLEWDGYIPPLEEVELEATEEEKEEADDGTISEESFEVLNMEEDNQIRKDNKNDEKDVSFEILNIQVHEMRKEIQLLEKELATAEQQYLKKLKEVEDRWERDLKNVEEEYKEEREIWEKQKNDLVSRLSSTTSQAEFYYIQAQDRDEQNRKLKEEKNDLSMKLRAAYASSEVYRNLLHNDLGLHPAT